MVKLRYFLLVMLGVPCVSLHAQQTDFASMKAQMTDQSLPLVNITCVESDLNKDDFIEGSIEIVDRQKRTDGENESVQYGADLRIRGGSIAGLQKKSFALKLFYYNDKGKKKDLDANVFGIREENSWILDAMGFDRVRMRNRICFDLWNEMSGTPYDTSYGNRNGTKGEFVEVFINGAYYGLFCLTDKIDRKLLDLKKYDKDKDIPHGLIYKGYEWTLPGSHLTSYDKSASTDGPTWCAWELEYPEDYPSSTTWQPLKDLIDFCSSSTSDDAFHASYNDYFYTSNLVDYMVMTLALNVIDNLYKNTFISVRDIAKGHRYLITPWDMDGSLGESNNGSRIASNMAYPSPNRYNSTAPYNRLYKKNMDGFVDEVKKRWLELQSTVFSKEHVYKALDDYAALFESSGAWQREYSKWGGNSMVPLPAKLSDELDYIKEWYERNLGNLYFQLGRKGDVNGDNKVNATDVSLLRDIIMEKTTDYTFYKADVNLDGVINAADIVEVINLIP